jgi:hypothetical protein
VLGVLVMEKGIRTGLAGDAPRVLQGVVGIVGSSESKGSN